MYMRTVLFGVYKETTLSSALAPGFDYTISIPGGLLAVCLESYIFEDR